MTYSAVELMPFELWRLVCYNMSVPVTMVHGNDRCGCKKLIVMIGCSAARKTIAIMRLKN